MATAQYSPTEGRQEGIFLWPSLWNNLEHRQELEEVNLFPWAAGKVILHIPRAPRGEERNISSGPVAQRRRC